MNHEFPILDEGVSEKVVNGYRHIACGKMLVGLTVTLSNRNGPMPLAGDGSVESMVVPYCLECDTKPPERGTFTHEGEILHPSVRNVA